MEQFCNRVVRFDLSGVVAPVQLELLDELLRKEWPIDFRISDDMSIVITNRAVNFTAQLDHGDLLVLSFQPDDHIGKLFANRGRCGRLTMGSRQHWVFGILQRPSTNLFD